MRRNQSSQALYEAFKRFVQTEGLIQRSCRVLAAVSGGIDSVTLLDLLFRLSDEWDLNLGILHVNHQLRGREANGDERFVEALAKRYDVTVHVARVKTKEESVRKKVSIQEAARHLRYAFFVTKKSELGADVVATAHTANDNAETMLLNFLRGTGIDGIAGIPIHRQDDDIVRPLLFATRQEIAAYAKERRLKFREDSSNRSDKYTRNFLRRKILPLLEKRINPSVVRTLSRSSEIFRDCADFLAGCVNQASLLSVFEQGGEVHIAKDALRKQHAYVRQMIVHNTLLRQGVEPTAERVTSVLSLLDGEKGSRVDCGDGWRGESSSQHIVLARRSSATDFSYCLDAEGTVAHDFFSLSVRKCSNVPNKLGTDSSIEYVDARKVQFPLHIRSWKEGDSFVPLGMKHRKKVSDFFVDLKISRSEKNRIPIVESNGNIVWVAGCRIDDRYKITSSSSEAYQLSIDRA